MKKVFKASLLGATLLFSSSFVLAQSTQEARLDSIEAVRHVFNEFYAPKKWKKVANGVFINPIFNTDRRRVKKNSDLSLTKYQQEIHRSIQDIEDYHVRMVFDSREAAVLPFNIVMVRDGLLPRYFVSHTFVEGLPVSVGDEIVSFDGQPTRLAIEKIWRQLGFQNHHLTDHRLLAQHFLTFRERALGIDTPQGNVSLGVIPSGSRRKQTIDMEWIYSPHAPIDDDESLTAQHALSLKEMSNVPSNTPEQRVIKRMRSLQMAYDVYALPEANRLSVGLDAQNPYQIGGRKTFTPVLGDILQEAPESSPFYWYTFLAADGNTYGYLRLPSYSAGFSDEDEEAEALEAQAALFGNILNQLEQSTDKLVLDQNHNPGGSILYKYELASMFAKQPLKVPLHQEALKAFDTAELEQEAAFLESLTSDEMAKAVLGNTFDGFEVTLDRVHNFARYQRDLLSEIQTGKKLSRPLPLAGVSTLEPHKQYRYSKPVLLLADALCFSGGDFFPAVMQDNDRMVIMGQTTAGAGGYVLQWDKENFPAASGIYQLSYTGSLAWRENGFPIESIGVIPDVFYHPTVKDIKTDYQPYKKAILKQLARL